MARDDRRSAAPAADTHGTGADGVGEERSRARWWPWTATGTRLLGCAVALLAAAWPLGYPEAAVLGGAGLLTALGTLAWSLPPRRISAQRIVVPARVARGDPAEAVVTLVNRGRRVMRRLALEDLCGGRPVPVAATGLDPGEPRETRYRLPTDRRGRVTVGPLRVVRADPLGLTRRASACAGETTLLVRPRVHPLPLLASGRAHHIEGPNSATADGGSQTFHALRGYVLGDDLRRVHWRSSARTGELMVRQMVDVSMPHTTVVLDTRSLAYAAPHAAASPRAEQAFELAVETAASVACAVLLRRFPLRLLGAAGRAVAEYRHSLTPDELLDALAVVEFTDEPTLAAAFDEVDRGRGGGTLVVVSGSHDFTAVRELARLADRFERTVVVRTSAPGEETGARKAPAGESRDHEPPDSTGVLPGDIPCLPVDGPDSLVAAWRRESVR